MGGRARRSLHVGERGDQGEEAGKGMHATANKERRRGFSDRCGREVRCGLHFLASQSCLWLCISRIQTCDGSWSRHISRGERPSPVGVPDMHNRTDSARFLVWVMGDASVHSTPSHRQGWLAACPLRVLSLIRTSLFSCVFISALLSLSVGWCVDTCLRPYAHSK